MLHTHQVKAVSLLLAGDRGPSHTGFNGDMHLEDPRGNPLEPLLVYSCYREPAIACGICHGTGTSDCKRTIPCLDCLAIGYIGIDPDVPTICKPGSYGKQAVLAARYRAAEIRSGMRHDAGCQFNAPEGFDAFMPRDSLGDLEVHYPGGE